MRLGGQAEKFPALSRPISVCVPTYNGERFLGETLASIAAQTFGDFEILVVDDGSTDSTLDIAERFAATDRRTRVVRSVARAGTGAGNANRCAELASGEWLKFVFQDDLIAPACLERMLLAGERGPLVVCWHDYRFEPAIPPDVRAWYEALPTLATELPGHFADPETLSGAVLRQPGANFIGPTSIGFFRRDCFLKHGGFDARFSFFPALECWLRIGCSEGLAIAPEQLVTYRVHDQSISGDIRRDPRRAFRSSLQHLRLALHFARSPRYETLRRVAATRSPRFDVEANLRTRAFEMRWHAIDEKFRARDTWALEQWEAFVAENPEMPAVMQDVDAGLSFADRLRQFVKRLP